MFKTTITIIISLLYLVQLKSQDFVIIGLPDTQYYSENGQEPGEGQGTGDTATFNAQTDWIVSNRVAMNIKYVFHVGDCVQNGDLIEQEWINAFNAMDKLKNQTTTGLTDGIPFGIAVGNHDQWPFGDETGTTNYYNQYFGVSYFDTLAHYGGHYGSNNDNHYDLFEVGSLKFVVVYIEYGWGASSDNSVRNWADDILALYPDRRAIVVSHRLLSVTGESKTQQDWTTEGNNIFNKLKDNPNLFLMLCGHYSLPSRRYDTNDNGGDVNTLMADYQEYSNGGNGYLRIMTFSPASNTIDVKTYSPTLDAYLTNEDNEFVINYDFSTPFPVELAYFTAKLNGNNIELRWKTETEVNNYGFVIERTNGNSGWVEIGFVEGYGNSNSPRLYNFVDNDINGSGTYYYRLKQIDNDGTYEYYNVVNVEIGIPSNFHLSQNYPNPFNPETRIDYVLPVKQMVTLKVYNTLGEMVAQLVNEVKAAGKYSVTFNASQLPSGVYIYRLETSEFVQNKKMSLVK